MSFALKIEDMSTYFEIGDLPFSTLKTFKIQNLRVNRCVQYCHNNHHFWLCQAS